MGHEFQASSVERERQGGRLTAKTFPDPAAAPHLGPTGNERHHESDLGLIEDHGMQHDHRHRRRIPLSTGTDATTRRYARDLAPLSSPWCQRSSNHSSNRSSRPLLWLRTRQQERDRGEQMFQGQRILSGPATYRGNQRRASSSTPVEWFESEWYFDDGVLLLATGWGHASSAGAVRRYDLQHIDGNTGR